MKDLIPINVLKKHNVAPTAHDGRSLSVIALKPDFRLRKQLERLSGLRVCLAQATQPQIDEALDRLSTYDDFQIAASSETQDAGLSDAQRLLKTVDDKVSSDPTVVLLSNLVNASIERKASDIHIEVLENSAQVKLRIDGVLVDLLDALPLDQCRKLMSRIKVLAELDIAEKRIPQDGRFRHTVFKKQIDCRVSIIPAKYGENAVLRLLGVQFDQAGKFEQTLVGLGISGQQYQVLKTAVNRPHGLVLLSGPTGSGKTTTLYAALNEIRDRHRKVITIEDPIEYELDHAMQIAVNNKKGVTFSSGLRSVLRHDPDIIMVGEIRDAETAKIAIQSALTGHLVLSTIHANSALDVFTRFVHMGVDKVDLLSALNGIVNQRLIRTLCPHCSGPVEASNQACDACSQTGYSGRTVIAESLLATDDFRKSTLACEKLEDVLDKIIQSTHSSLREQAQALLNAGQTTQEEVDRVTFD